MPFRLYVKVVSVSQADTNPADADAPITTTSDARLPAQPQKGPNVQSRLD